MNTWWHNLITSWELLGDLWMRTLIRRRNWWNLHNTRFPFFSRFDFLRRNGSSLSYKSFYNVIIIYTLDLLMWGIDSCTLRAQCTSAGAVGTFWTLTCKQAEVGSPFFKQSNNGISPEKLVRATFSLQPREVRNQRDQLPVERRLWGSANTSKPQRSHYCCLRRLSLNTCHLFGIRRQVTWHEFLFTVTMIIFLSFFQRFCCFLHKTMRISDLTWLVKN
jgi:hypothetical protein